MISADHPRFSCTSDMSLTIYGEISSGPLVHPNDPSGTGVIIVLFDLLLYVPVSGGYCRVGHSLLLMGPIPSTGHAKCVKI